MRVLVACEYSGLVRDAFRRLGHEAWSCDLRPSELPGWHLQCDVRDVLDWGWDLMVAHPPCTHLANSGARWWSNKAKEQAESLELVRTLLGSPIPRIALENPAGRISTAIRRPDQRIQPWQFGDEYQKTTCLWLCGLPPLRPTKVVSRGEFVTHGGRRFPKWYSNRERDRSKTFPGIARAMAEQWGR